MPTVNPRVNVTLSPSLDALVIDLARLQRASKSQVLRELLEAAEPALQRAVKMMEAAASVTSGYKEGLKRTLDAEIDRAEAEVVNMLGFMDQTTLDLVDQAEAIRGRRPSRARAMPGSAPAVAKVHKRPKDPPSSNRGVNPSQKTVARKARGVKS